MGRGRTMMLPPGPEGNTARRRVYENTARDNILGSAMRTV